MELDRNIDDGEVPGGSASQSVDQESLVNFK